MIFLSVKFNFKKIHFFKMFILLLYKKYKLPRYEEIQP